MYATLKTLVLLGSLTLSKVAFGQFIVHYGQQLQDDDQANHWVAWQEPTDPCYDEVVLDVLINDPCAQNLTLGELIFQFDGCTMEGMDSRPGTIQELGGSEVGACKGLSTKEFHCRKTSSRIIHDVIDHGFCTVIDGE